MLSYFIFYLPICAVLSAAVGLAAYFLTIRRRGKRPLPRLLALWALLCYGLFLIYLTILWYWPYITFHPDYHFLNLEPFIWLRETYIMGREKMLEQLALNIGMFVPLGLLLPAVFPRLRRFLRTALTSLGVTLAIETLQYFMGRSADIDDVIMNLLGGMLGYALFALADRLFRRYAWWRAALRPGPPAQVKPAEPAPAEDEMADGSLPAEEESAQQD